MINHRKITVNYKYLSQIGQHYDAEEGTSGVRFGALTGVETKLKQAIVDLRQALQRSRTARPLPQLPNAAGPGKGVKSLAGFFEAKQKQLGPGKIGELEAKVNRLKAWLSRQGVSVDNDGNIQWSQDTARVIYDHDAVSQGLTRIRFRGGRLFLDDACTQPLNTAQMVTHFTGPGYAIYVMSQQGNIHVSSHSVGSRHHSSLLAGGNVAGAGELAATAGTLTYLSNKSGHYRPSLDHLLQTLHQLEKNGVLMNFEVVALTSGGSTKYPNPGALMRALELDEQPDYELQKLLAYSAHITDAILNPHGWGWRWDPSTQRPGVYETGSGVMVPHKVVRQWLKGQGLHAAVDVQSGAGR